MLGKLLRPSGLSSVKPHHMLPQASEKKKRENGNQIVTKHNEMRIVPKKRV